MPRRKRTSGEYLVAEPAGVPGVTIPLLSDEEGRARGIEPGRFPPRETWTQEQRDAADRLVEILLPHAYREALEAILTELEGELRDSAIADTDKEKLAAQRSIALIDAGKWKHQHTDISRIRQVMQVTGSSRMTIYRLERAGSLHYLSDS